MRRSFTGNPFNKPSIVPIHGAKTPANSPLDFSRRGSVGVRESGGSLRDSLDNKENGKDQSLKPVKVRSPAVCSKGSKNFMSPTISASCKINESLRKGVLTERNEVVPSPVDPKSHVRKLPWFPPLGVDPLIPPYDPKTNYLSPRSRMFLRIDLVSSVMQLLNIYFKMDFIRWPWKYYRYVEHRFHLMGT
ncbi:uncharacterized protein LOC111242089 [Vigna radiata var. radiata]|uniref:Uncharacterized protein LOC111242089 n=1 Tax=Vigna radiata var. radiata TaxID=3916 RepID=A0A3Q0FBZ7_VIGRR|nr:uncharacterized protein LOC111242089 [Vigna radiata var. radiata]